MPRPLSRRRRRLAWTIALAAAFVVVTAALLWIRQTERSTYRPGEDIEGLTAALDRELRDDPPAATFTDATRAAGIDFRHFSGARTSQLPEDMGSGAAWGDYDNDGDLDLYVANLAGPLTMTPAERAASPARNHLYRNDGGGAFTEVAEAAGVDFRGWAMAAAWGDYDDDGWIDLFVTAFGANTLYRNNGDGTFTDRTRESGFGGVEGFWAGASWGDYDNDGDLDLYVAGYVRYVEQQGGMSLQYDVESPASINPSSFAPERNLLYRNTGSGRFEEVGLLAGVDNPEGRSLSAAWADFDDDGWLDLYVANDVSDNVLYRNLGTGAFEEISHRALVADYRGAMGIATGDWDGDADTDLFVTHWIAQENALYSNQRAEALARGAAPVLRFMDVADRHGLGQIALDFIGWGTSFFDYDNDGRLDLLVVNGSTFQQPEAAHLLIPMRDQLFWNRGPEAGFFEVSAAAGSYFETPRVGRGAAFADYDNDGDVDVFVVNHDGPGVLLRNDPGTGAEERHGWLEVAPERSSGSPALGARVRIVAGGAAQVRQIGAQPSYCSQNGPVAHFGLGTAAVVDTVEVVWPGGARRTRTGVPANRILRLRPDGAGEGASG